jgi:hypothetical protein
MKTFAPPHPLVAALGLALGLALAPAHAAPPQAHDHGHAAAAVSKRVATGQALRDLWSQHTFWVRSYVVASVDKNAAARDVAAQQVVENAKAISGAVASFYGQAGGDHLLKLLAGHWGAVKAYSDATDQAGRDKAVSDLNANAGEIAKFLSTANPHLKENAVLGLLAAHGGHHIVQIDQLKAGDYAAEAKTWDAMRTHMYTLADALTDALARQFPKRF